MSRVRVALIPPFSLVSQYVAIEPHQHYLFLPQFLKDQGNIRYKNMIKKVVRTDGYTILDNGSFEGELVDSGEVEELAIEYGIDEIVVSDVMGNAEESFELLTVYKPNDGKKYMAVVQGRNVEQCEEYIRRVNASSRTKYITTLGLPKHLLETCKDPLIRIRLTRLIRDTNPDYAVHFLGGSHLNPCEIREAAHFRVRSMDTSMPFVYAFCEEAIKEEPGSLMVRDRPMDYFKRRPGEFNEAVLNYNIHTLKEWANGKAGRI